MQITNSSYQKIWPALSADFSTLVFDAPDGIMALNTNGSNLHYVVKGNASVFSHLPVISANGSRIVFAKYTDNNFDKLIYTIKADGSDLTGVSPGPIIEAADFTIYLDGSKVAFENLDSNQQKTVDFANSDGTGFQELAGPPFYSPMFPLLSANGAKMAFYNPSGDELGSVYTLYTAGNQLPTVISKNIAAYWQTKVSADG